MNQKQLKEDLENAGFTEKNNKLKGFPDLIKLFEILSKNGALDSIKIKEHTEEYENRIKEHEKMMTDIKSENSVFKFKSHIKN